MATTSTAYKLARPIIKNGWLSRKLVLAVLASIVAFGNAYWDWGLTLDEVLQIISPLLLWIGVEGLADVKER